MFTIFFISLKSEKLCAITMFLVTPTDPFLGLGKGLGEPIGDELEDVSSLAPATDAVQQLAVLCRSSSRVHPPQSGQDSTASTRKQDKKTRKTR